MVNYFSSFLLAFLILLDFQNILTQGMGNSSVQQLLDCHTHSREQQSAKAKASESCWGWQDPTQTQIVQVGYYNCHACDLSVLNEGKVVRMLPFKIGDHVWDWICSVFLPIKHCRLFNAQSIFIHINSSISNNLVQHKYSFFFIYAQLNVKTVLFQTIQFSTCIQFQCQKSSVSNNSV